ncbi:SUN domain-containing protein 3-like [Python bivittatus]|uniref:SUN domain-containing protein 3-like n=1 Tax=Python bivittatus TaxID=176946 RepID=A0A9F5MVD0_PYTBI|nr:SUN domain-containing protein 3-like [Python bivittatus]
MNGKRSVQRCPGQATQGFQENSTVQDNSSNETTGSGGTQSNSWYLRNSTRGCPRMSTTSSSQMTSICEEGEENGRDLSNRGQIIFTREVIGREASSSTFSSNSSAASEQSVLKTICGIPSLMAFTIICLFQNLLQPCVFVRERITMANCMKGLKRLIIAVLIICGTIYCFYQYLKISDGLSSKELTERYESELKALWKSQNFLEEQIREIQSLKKETDRLRSEISSINEGILWSVKQILEESDIPGENTDQVLDMINLTFKKIYEDHVQMADWAQKTVGATIDKDRTSKSYVSEYLENCWSFLSISSANPPDTILQPDVHPGNCWAFQGSEGQAVIRLPEKIQPTAVTVQHITKAISPVGEVSSALKDFLVYGLNDETNEEILLGTFMYDIEKEAIQTFQLKNEQEKNYQYIKFKVQSNWGNPKFTCIYRVRVHGKRVNVNLLAGGEILQDE